MSGLSFDVKDRTCLFFLEKMRNVFQEIEIKYCVTLHCKALARFELISTIWNLPKQLLLFVWIHLKCVIWKLKMIYRWHIYMVLWTWIDTTILIQCPRRTCYHFNLSTRMWLSFGLLVLCFASFGRNAFINKWPERFWRFFFYEKEWLFHLLSISHRPSLVNCRNSQRDTIWFYCHNISFVSSFYFYIRAIVFLLQHISFL